MPSALPAGDPAPADGSLPGGALAGLGERPFGFYVHVPFCTVRCGYCDFNTYTAERARRTCPAPRGRRTPRRRSPRSGWPAGCSATSTCRSTTVFFGGGTPTLLPPGRPGRGRRRDRRRVRARRRAPRSPPSPTPTASPPATSAALRDGGVTRISLRHAVGGRRTCCAVLDRTHDPLRVPAVVGWAREAGFEQVSLDLIYGTPGESLADWRDLARRGAGLRARPRLGVLPDRRGRHRAGPAGPPRRGADARRRRPRRQVPARRRARSSAAGLRLVRGVELGARPRPAAAGTTCCYWTGGDWWGVGPGAHSHVGGVRWWNVKHPAAYADRIAAGRQPGARRARCSTTETRRVERVLLEIRLRDGLPRRRARRRRPGRGRRTRWRAGCVEAGPAGPAGADHARAGCSPTPSCATCCPELTSRMVSG